MATSVYDGPTKLFINNEWVDSVSGKTFKTINPVNEEVLALVSEADKADVNIAVKAARDAFEGKEWGGLDGSQRRDLMLKLASLIERDAEKLAIWESLDNGKPRAVARAADVHLTIQCYRYYAGWADKQQGKTIPVDGKFFVYTKHEPVGVCGQIIPWNFPLLMQAWKLGPALATGCTVVLKTSEKTPLTGLMIAALIKEAGFPPGVVNILSGYGPTAGAALSEHMDVDKVAFTGSTAVGRKVLVAAAQSNMKRVSLEMGGKSPLIVMPDADLAEAVETARIGLFFNMGQCCIASSRIFVHADIYDAFVAEAAKQALATKIGDPFDDNNFQGPLVDKIQFDKVMSYIEAGIQGGARLVCGGNRLGNKGYFINPTVFADVSDEMRIAAEEIFGPVQTILKFNNLEEALARANNTSYGLGAGVCTRDVAMAIKIADKIKAGTIYVNCYNIFRAAAPFGGFKQSGHHRELGEYGLESYTEIKTVIVSLDR